MGWATTQNPRTNFVTTRFSDVEASDLDLLAAQHGGSRSEAIRAAVEQAAKAARRKAQKSEKTGK